MLQLVPDFQEVNIHVNIVKLNSKENKVRRSVANEEGSASLCDHIIWGNTPTNEKNHRRAFALLPKSLGEPTLTSAIEELNCISHFTRAAVLLI
jgi:hypothetical protein